MGEPGQERSSRSAQIHERLIAPMLRAASIEASVRNLAEVEHYRLWLEPGREVFIPWLPGLPFHHSLSVARRLRQAGLEPVPHLAARRIDSAASAAAFLAQLQSEAAVRHVLLVGGDSLAAAGPFPGALELLQTGLLQAHGISRVSFAAYPESHPRVPDPVLAAALIAKIERARAASLAVQVITQFCFEAEPIIGLLGRLRALDRNLPVRVGLAAPASIRSLLAFAARCGIGPSVRAVWDGPVSLRDLLSRHGPDRLLEASGEKMGEKIGEALGEATGGSGHPGLPGLHLFAFGGVRTAAAWLRARAGGAEPALLQA
jgi:methylenetetrahydrofolate reductase (NADPH)